MQNNISLRQITLNDKNNMQALDFLIDITKSQNGLYLSPVPDEIVDDSSLESIDVSQNVLDSGITKLSKEIIYLGFLKSAEDDVLEQKVFRYWILKEDKIIGYSSITVTDNTGDIGIILSSDERGKNIGLEAMKLLLKESKENLKLDNITITTSSKNIPMQRLCEKLGGNLISSDDNFKYNVK